MILPTDNQTEGVVITDAPPSVPKPPPPIASGPGLMPFTPMFRERALWLAMLGSLAILLVSYQFSIWTYINTSTWWYFNSIGDGWHSGNRLTDGSLWTSSTGAVYIRNFGYPLSDYQLQVFASGYDGNNQPYTHTATISMGSQELLTFDVKELTSKRVLLSAGSLRSVGPDPAIIIRDITKYPPGTGGEHGVALWSLYLQNPDLNYWNPALPPLDLILLIPLLSLLIYAIARRRSSAKASAVRALNICAPLLLLSITLRTVLFLFYSGITLIAGLIALYRWRRELANWLLHLRHPDDERFRMA
jgi:hypothetical protein